MDARSTKTKNFSLSEKVEENVEFRKYLLKCGNFAQATYDAFDSDVSSENAGKSRYTKEELFSKVKLVDAEKYKIHTFLYATTGVAALLDRYFRRPRTLTSPTLTGLSNWIGYVACNTDEEIESSGRLEIFVALRGTLTLPEWKSNVDASLVPAKELLFRPRDQGVVPESFFSDDAQVHRGWLSIYTSTGPGGPERSLKDQISASVADLIDQHKGREATVVVTGHSLGGALATLAAYDLAVHEIGSGNVPVDAVIFSAPPSGNAAFKKQVDSIANLRILHVWVDNDIVPVIQQAAGLSFVPIHTAGLALVLERSPYLNNVSPRNRIFVLHDLEVVLHLLAGYHSNGTFAFVVPRDPKLVNKHTDASSDFPANWWA